MIDKLVQLDTAITLGINGSESSMMDYVMLIITSTVAWIPLGVFVLWHVYKNYGTKTLLYVLLGMGLCIFAADMISSGIVKPLVARWRPTRDPGLMYVVDVVNGYRGGRYGFFSSHAANTMSVAVFLCMFFRKKIITGLFIFWSLLNCWSRIYLGVHYFGDVVVGILCGLIVGWCVYKLYRRIGGQNANTDSYPVAVACMLTYVCILLVAPFMAA